MKKNLTLLATILLCCSIAVSVVAQESQQKNQLSEIRKLLEQANTDHQFVTVKIKPGGRIGDFTSSNKPLPNGKTLTGEILYVSEVGFGLKQIMGEQKDFMYFDVISEVKPANKNVVEWSKFGDNTTKEIKKIRKAMTPIGEAIMAIPLIISGKIRFCC